jgi:type IV secretion system protein VirB1
MTLDALTLAALLTHCAPTVSPSTMTAIVQVESGGNPLAIGDNTTRRSYYPRNRSSAEALAGQLLEQGHLLDIGIAQIDSMNLAGFGVNVHTIFDPCVNLSVGARILSGDYAVAHQRYGDSQIALRHAIGMYNTGRLNAGESYIRSVLAAAGIQERHPGNGAASPRDTPRPTLLVGERIPDKRSPSTPRSAVMPSRAPILISIARPPGISIF